LEPEADIDWAPAATVPDARQARDLLELLAAAGIPARLEAGPVAGGGGLRVPAWFAVLVPVADVPVAVGVADRCLPWFGGGSGGGLSEAECIAALDEPGEPEFASRLDAERRQSAAGLWVARILSGLVALAVAAAIARSFVGR
jgi:hypothetical protein